MDEGSSVVHAGIPLWALTVPPVHQYTSTPVPPKRQPAWIFAKKWEQRQLFSEHTAHLYYSFLL